MLHKKRRSLWALDEGICGIGEGKVQRILNPDTGWKWDSCRELFKNLKLFPLQSPFIFSLLFVVKSRELFTSISDVHNVNTGYNSDSHLPIANSTVFQMEFFILELEFSTNFHQLSKIYHMMWNTLNWP